MRLALLLCLVPTLAVAQTPDSGAGRIPLPVTDSALRLPVDRPADLLPWIPGGSLDPDGFPVWRGHREWQMGRRVDGVTWGSVTSGIPASSWSTSIIPIGGWNGLAGASLLGGIYSVADGSLGPAAFDFRTAPGGDHWSTTGSAESGAPFRADGGDGVTRFDLVAGGPLAAGWRLRASAAVLGRQSLPMGVGYAAAPFYAPTGIDTTFTWEATPGDTVSAPVITFAPASRVPTSPRTTSDLVLRADGSIGPAAVWIHYLRGTDAERVFSYLSENNPANSFGRDSRAQDLSAGITLPRVAGWEVRGALAWQEEQAQTGPIDPANQVDTRDPALGILASGAGLRYTLSTFPVNDELVWNYRSNTPGSRRSPYDLENTDQYRLADNFRNNAFAVNGFDESGGPIGTVTLYRDRRVSLQGDARRAVGPGILRVGGELRHHTIQSYSHALVSQALSDVWIASPNEQAAYGEWSVARAGLSLAAGLRVDRFITGARRPDSIPRLSSLGFLANPATRQAEYDSLTTPDQGHTAVSPRVNASLRVSPTFVLHGDAGRLARTPDLRYQLAGINTDLSITSTSAYFGTDYGHEITDLFQGGVTFGSGPLTIDGTFFREHQLATPVISFVTVYDPVKAQNNDILRVLLGDIGWRHGVTVSGTYAASSAVHLRGSYTYLPGPGGSAWSTRVLDSTRTHSLALVAEATSPWHGALGGLGVVAAYRRSSGMARTIASAFPPFPFPIARSADLAAWNAFDLRLTKGVPLGGHGTTIYLDVRNLFNASNQVVAFSDGDPARNTVSEDLTFGADSASWAQEATQNGLYAGNGSIDLSFGGAGRSGCGSWVDQGGRPSPVNCAYMINAEKRFGNGDGVYTLGEQRTTALAYYRSLVGPGTFNAQGRAVRLGLQFTL